MAGYTRQSTFADGDTITAALFNNEYNQLLNAFSNTGGHKHDGTAAEGPVIGLIGDAGETAPNNKVLIDTTNNYIEFYVEVSSNPVQQLYIADGAIIPVTDSDIDLGTTSLRFKDTYTDTITTTGNVAVGGNLTVTGTTTFNGGTITMGDAATDNVVFGADVDSNIIPDDDDSYDLGSSSQEWRNLYIDGTANIDSLVADTADINGGTIDGAIIGGSSAAAITGTAITGTSFVIGSATITEAELEILDGATVTTDELNILDGVTSTAAELNLLDGVTSTTAELNILDGVTASATDINLIDGITNGTVIASKAIITDANKDITGGRNITISGELDAGSLDVSGNVDVDGTLETDALSINGTTVTSTAAELNILDGVTATATELNLIDGVTATTAELNILDGVTATAAEINALDGITSTVAELNILDGVTSTAAELNLLDGKAFLDEDNMASNSATGIASQQSIKAYVDTTVAATNEVVEDTTPQLGGDLDLNSSDITGTGNINVTGTIQSSGNITGTLATAAQPNITSVGTLTGLTTTGDINFGDSDKAIFGAGSDLQIYHDGTNSVIADEGTGDTYIQGSSVIRLTNVGASEHYAKFNENGAVELRYDNSIKFTTTSTGIDVTGTVTADGATISSGSSGATASGNADELILEGSGNTGLSILSGATSLGNLFFADSGDAADGYIQYDQNGRSMRLGTAGGEKVRIDSSGNVGIGTTSPTEKLHISGSSPSGDITARIVNTDTSSATSYASVSLVGGNNEASIRSIHGTGGAGALAFYNENAERMRISSNGQVLLTAAHPSIQFTDSSDNSDAYIQADGGTLRFFADDNNEVGSSFQSFHIDGSEKMRIDSSGRLGIGTTSPVSFGTNNVGLTVNGSAGSHLAWQNNGTNVAYAYNVGNNFLIGSEQAGSATIFTSAGSQRMRIDASGNVGIGRTSIAQPSTGATTLAIQGTDNNKAGAIRLYSANDSVAAYIYPDSVSGLSINTSTNHPMVFRTAGTERMRIDSSGHVGIGMTPAPVGSDTCLSIYNTVSPRIKLHNSTSGTASGDGAELNTFNSDFIIENREAGNLRLFNNGSERMRIDSSGSIAIGSANVRRDLASNTSPVLSLEGTFPAINLRDSGTGEGCFFGLNGDTVYIGGHTNTAAMQVYVNGSEKMRITSTGSVGIGKTAPSEAQSGGHGYFFVPGANGYYSHVSTVDTGNFSSYFNRKTQTGGFFNFVVNDSGVGSITSNGSATAYNTSSDYRLKENVDYNFTALDRVAQLKPARFNFIADAGTTVDGFLAHEVQDIVPEAIRGEKDAVDDEGNPEYQGIDQSKLVPLLTKAIQEQQTQIDALQSEINLLKGE